MPSPALKGITIRGLEVFEALARTGSVGETARILGLSAPAVSQQMKNLSAAVGAELIDTSRRPLLPTPAGRLYLSQAQDALKSLRAAQRALTSVDLSALSTLSLGVIDDFENVVTPTLATRLAEGMSQCEFTLQTAPSHRLLARIAARDLDMAIAAVASSPPLEGSTLLPLVEDPYILALPKGHICPNDLAELTDMPFLRRDQDQLMGQQIEEWLARGPGLPARRFEVDSNQTISALVAAGVGWTITTPLSLLRAVRFADGIDAHPLPGPPLSRQIALIAAANWSNAIPDQIAGLGRELIGSHFVDKGHERLPWLESRFRLLA